MTTIEGKSVATLNQMKIYIKKVNPNVPSSVLNMIQYYISEGEIEGIRGDVAFAQSCLETGNFTFSGSAVTLSQNNFAGLGVTQLGMKGNSWATPQLGIRAQIQHLKAYATTSPLKQTCVDERYKYVVKGCAKYVEWLGIQENPTKNGWASGKDYGTKILKILDNILDCDGKQIKEKGVDTMKINVHAGHNFKVPGASGIFSETSEDRKVKDLVISKLKALGHTVYDCTDEIATTVRGNLEEIVRKCNAHAVDLDVSIHFNAATGSGHGVEVCVYSMNSKSVPQAKNIATAISELGFTKRHESDGGLIERNGLYVLRHTNSPALLIECCFCDSKTDAALYKAETMANAIVKGITGQTTSASTTTSNNTATSTTTTKEEKYMFNPVTCKVGDSNTSVLLLQEILKARGYYTGRLDRKFGKELMNAVNKYQIERMKQGKKIGNGKGDGVCGQDMWRDLIAI